ncbi:MAG: hypothetical protein ACXWUG_08105 [Polyangiales bacterium]
MHRWIGVAVLGSAAFVGGAALVVAEAHRRPALLMGDTASALPPKEEESGSAPTAIGGGPSPAPEEPPAPAEQPPAENAPTENAAVTTVAEETPAPAASASASASASAAPTVTVIVPAPSVSLAAPVFGAPPPSAPSGPPVVGGATPGDKPLYMGPSGGSTNPAIVDAKPTITARVLVPMSDAGSTEGFWGTVTPFLRGGDMVVATAHGDGSALLAFSDRVRTDTPLVSYAVAFDRPDSLEAALGKLPDGLEIVGLSQTSGIDDKRLTDLSNKVHAAGRRFFVSTNLTGPSLQALGARVDVVEISGTSSAAKAATAVMQTTGRPQIFVRISSATPGHALETANTSNAILKGMPDAGIALPFTAQVGSVLSDLRAPP